MQVVREGASVKVVLEYNRNYDRWSVWSTPTWVDRLFLMKTGSELFGVGRTKEAALTEARAKLESRGEEPRRLYKTTEL